MRKRLPETPITVYPTIVFYCYVVRILIAEAGFEPAQGSP